jgi:hypothetical protein
MWINPKTDKSWTDEEECAFAEIMAAGKLERLTAIRLYRRFKGDLQKALKSARRDAPTDQEVIRRTGVAARMRLRHAEKRGDGFAGPNSAKNARTAVLANAAGTLIATGEGSVAPEARNREVGPKSQGGSRRA